MGFNLIFSFHKNKLLDTRFKETVERLEKERSYLEERIKELQTDVNRFTIFSYPVFFFIFGVSSGHYYRVLLDLGSKNKLSIRAYKQAKIGMFSFFNIVV